MDIQTMVQIMEDIGLKQSKVAMNCAIHPVIFSDYIRNRRNISPEKLQRVEDYLTKIKNALER